MSKPPLRWSKAFSIISAAIMGSCLSSPLAAFALPEATVIEKLKNVPTFSIVNAEGQLVPLQFAPKGKEPSETSLPLIFINPQAALTALDNITKQKPELKSNLQVLPVRLSQVYEIMKEAQEKKAEKPPIALIPILPEIQSAIAVRKANGETVEKPEQVGIPLFFASIGEKQQYMVLKDTQEKSYIPFYWKKEQVERDIAAYKEQVPEASAKDIKIQSISFNQFLQALLNTDNEAVEIMEIVPTQEQVQTANKLVESATKKQ